MLRTGIGRSVFTCNDARRWREVLAVALGSLLFAAAFSYPLWLDLHAAHPQHDWPWNLQVADCVLKGCVGFSHVTCVQCQDITGWDYNLALNFFNPEARMLTPWLVLHLLFGAAVGLRLEVIGHIAVGFAGAYVLARVVGATWVGAAACALTFMGASGYYLHLGVGHVTWMGYVYAPWIIAVLL
jgi:hypothetical protein